MKQDQKPKSCEEAEEELLADRREEQDQQIVKTGSVTPLAEVRDPLSDHHRAGGGALYPSPHRTRPPSTSM